MLQRGDAEVIGGLRFDDGRPDRFSERALAFADCKLLCIIN
jgi:hypothetical protein